MGLWGTVKTNKMTCQKSQCVPFSTLAFLPRTLHTNPSPIFKPRHGSPSTKGFRIKRTSRRASVTTKTALSFGRNDGFLGPLSNVASRGSQDVERVPKRTISMTGIRSLTGHMWCFFHGYGVKVSVCAQVKRMKLWGG